MTGLASGLVETMREIGGAVGVAAVSTVLVSRAGEIAARPTQRRGDLRRRTRSTPRSG
jgi:hypothetical protein